MTVNSRYQKIFLLSLGFFLLLLLMAVFHENGILNAYQLEQEQHEIKTKNESLKIMLCDWLLKDAIAQKLAKELVKQS